MTGDSDNLNVTEIGRHEVQEKSVTAGVDGDQIGHQTQPPGEAQELEERKRRLAAEAFIKAKQERAAAAAAASPAPGDPKRNQGSVVAVAVIVGVFVLMIAGFVILMWRLGKSESAVKEHLLTFVRDR
jgi:hypothetical protein